MSAAAKAPFETLPLRQDALARLLLLVAKVSLNPQQADEARRLASEVSDWEAFARIATKKFAVTLAHQHLQAHAVDIVPAAAMAQLKQAARTTTMATLRVAGAHVAFHKTCIEPTEPRYAYIKGIALTRQFYAHVGDRFCRDIDILVAAEDFDRVLQKALASGYRAYFDTDPRQFASTPEALAFLTRYADVVSLTSADNISIELHRRLDKRSLSFDLERALDTAIDVAFSGICVKTLAPEFGFNYICYHHSRHFWSHLHWLADLDAMARACDRSEVLRLADSIGIRPTIDAAYAFQDLISRPGLWTNVTELNNGGVRFLQACLYNLEGDLELERELRFGKIMKDFMSPWQVSRERSFEFMARSVAQRLKPRESQYVAHPYPAWLHWIYSVQNAWKDVVRAGEVTAHRIAGPQRAPSE